MYSLLVDEEIESGVYRGIERSVEKRVSGADDPLSVCLSILHKKRKKEKPPQCS